VFSTSVTDFEPCNVLPFALAPDVTLPVKVASLSLSNVKTKVSVASVAV